MRLQFLGMFMGPVFPSGIIMTTKMLLGHLHIPSIGFSTALGGTGGAVFPFLAGAIAQSKSLTMISRSGRWYYKCVDSVKWELRHERLLNSR